MKDEKSAADHTLDVTLKRVDELHQQVEELKTQLLTKGNRKNRSIQGLWDQVLGRTADGRFYSSPSTSRTEAGGGHYFFENGWKLLPASTSMTDSDKGGRSIRDQVRPASPGSIRFRSFDS